MRLKNPSCTDTTQEHSEPKPEVGKLFDFCDNGFKWAETGTYGWSVSCETSHGGRGGGHNLLCNMWKNMREWQSKMNKALQQSISDFEASQCWNSSKETQL